MDRKEIFERLCIQRQNNLWSAISDDIVFQPKIEGSAFRNELDIVLDLTDKIMEKSYSLDNSKHKPVNIYHEFTENSCNDQINT